MSQCGTGLVMSIYHQAREGNTNVQRLKQKMQSLAGVTELQPASEVTLTAVLLTLALEK